MEAFGLAVSVFPIFSLCLEYFEYFKTAQSVSADSQILLLKLDFEHERFVIWGEKHGIGNNTNGTQDPGLDDSPTLKLVKSALGLIESLFKDSKALYDKYGVKQITSNGEPEQVETKEKFISTAALRRIKRKWKRDHLINGTGHSETRSGLAARTKWAIYDKTKFEVMVKDIRDLVTGLHDILPVPNKERDRIVLDDMKSLLPDTGRLKQFELASEDLYPSWSEAASLIVLVSEMGSVAPNIPNRTQIQDFVKESTENIKSAEKECSSSLTEIPLQVILLTICSKPRDGTSLGVKCRFLFGFHSGMPLDFDGNTLSPSYCRRDKYPCKGQPIVYTYWRPGLLEFRKPDHRRHRPILTIRSPRNPSNT